MSIQITINGNNYNLPVQGQSPPWGQDLTDIILALTTVASNIVGTGDITTTSFILANNQSSASNVTDLSFDPGTIRSAIIQYSVHRSTSLSEEAETGTLFLTYKNVSSTWDITRAFGGSSSVVFTITNAGQIQYTTSNLTGTSYSGLMKFSAKAYTQT